jgi:hypothetical protein
VTEPEPPSWWKYVGGRDKDRQWARFYAETEQRTALPARDRSFYLAAIMRLADDTYAKPAHRPPDVVNFWFTCRYQLATSSARPKAAAIDTARLASDAGIATGHTPKAIQRHAKALEKPAKEFLHSARNQIRDEMMERGLGVPSDGELNEKLIEWIERMVRKVA